MTVEEKKRNALRANDPFPENLRDAMERKGFTQRMLAQRMYKSDSDAGRQRVGRFMRGEQKPNFDELVVIAEVLDESIDYLVGRKESSSGLDSAADVIRVIEQMEKVMYDTVVEVQSGRIAPNARPVDDPRFVEDVIPPQVVITLKTYNQTIVSYFRRRKIHQYSLQAPFDDEEQKQDAVKYYEEFRKKALVAAKTQLVPMREYFWITDQDGHRQQSFYSREDAVKYAETMGYSAPDGDTQVETSQPRDGTSSSRTTKRGSGQEGRAKGSL